MSPQKNNQDLFAGYGNIARALQTIFQMIFQVVPHGETCSSRRNSPSCRAGAFCCPAPLRGQQYRDMPPAKKLSAAQQIPSPDDLAGSDSVDILWHAVPVALDFRVTVEKNAIGAAGLRS